MLEKRIVEDRYRRFLGLSEKSNEFEVVEPVVGSRVHIAPAQVGQHAVHLGREVQTHVLVRHVAFLGTYFFLELLYIFYLPFPRPSTYRDPSARAIRSAVR